MKIFPRFAGSAFLLTLLLMFGGVSLAQETESEPIKVVGSGIVRPLFDALAAASEAELSATVDVTGTTSGFQIFCRGEADILNASRAISIAEDADCLTGGVAYAELVAGYNILAVVGHPEDTITECLTATDINMIFAPSATGQITNWNQVSAALEDLSLSLYTPGSNTAAYALLDRLTEGDGLRTDTTTAADDQAIIDAAAETKGALGVVSLSSALAAGDRVKVLELGINPLTGCNLPSAENVENRLYDAVDPLYVYINRESLSKSGVETLANFIVSEDSAAVVEEQGFIAPTALVVLANQESLTNSDGGRVSTVDSSTFEIPTGVSGVVMIGGAASADSYIDSMTGNFSAIYPGVTFSTTTDGQPAGLRRLCNGEIDIALVNSEPTEEQAENCEANNIITTSLGIGSQGVVLLANEASAFLGCLKQEQLSLALNASSSESVTSWRAVDSSFAEQPITLFAPRMGSSTISLLMTQVNGVDTPIREVTEESNDPLYRAAATANVEGAITIMSWQEYQRVLSSGQERIQVVAVDAGSGCITPDESSIQNGSYPLSQRTWLLVNQARLSKIELQSFLWYLVTDENYSVIEFNGFIGGGFGTLPAVRDQLKRAFAQAIADTAVEEIIIEPLPEPAPAEESSEDGGESGG